MKIKAIVQPYNGVPRTNSRLVAEGFGLTHRAIVNHIQKYRIEFEDFGELPIEVFKEKKKELGIHSTELKLKPGTKEKSYWLNEEQFMFLGTLVDNSEISVKFKHALIKDYSKCKKLLANITQQQTTEEWQAARIEGKTEKLIETDGIKAFIEYAKSQGSENAEMYCSNITRMENATLFVVAGKFKNLRDVMTSRQLRTIGVADGIVEKALADGMAQGLGYKEVFKLAKARVINFAALYGQSEIVEQKLLGI